MTLSPQLRWNRAHPEAMAAHAQVRRAKRRGEIRPMSCIICGAYPAEAHHDSYEPGCELDVTWLCRFHHRRHHDKGPGDLFTQGDAA